jgi:hypothetical protein
MSVSPDGMWLGWYARLWTLPSLCVSLAYKAGVGQMKVHVEVECSPEEARAFLGLPDVTKANEAYMEGLAKAMQGAGGVEQLQEYAKQLAPMGQMGLKLFQQFMESGAGFGIKK